MGKKTIIVSIFLSICLIIEGFIVYNLNKEKTVELSDVNVNLTDLTYKTTGDYVDVTTYSQDDFESFLSDYKSGDLPDMYITEFVFDGVGMYKTYDLDDFIDDGNYLDLDAFKTTALNINSSGTYVLSGDFKGIVLVDTNDLDGDVNINFNGVNINSDSKKIPAIYVYNKDISYTDHKVTISALDGTDNYITGGKFKKISLVGSDELASYSSKYSGEASDWYNTYTNYYGVYTSDQINNILFAKVTADSEDLNDGDPYYFYKGAGAISSDIDLYFEGAGYLEVTSIGKEGIETKGNLVFSGGIGDYVVNANDDCLNTTTKSSVSGARNDLVIDVNSLVSIVDLDADEGDAIDSNGSLTINGGTIIAIAHPGSDAGLDSESGTYINGGTILATGDMYDQILSDSKQSFMALSFSDRVVKDDIITFVDSNNNVIFSYKTDRDFSNLVYSSSKLSDGDYSLYKNGTIAGNSVSGFYNSVDSFIDGIMLGYTGNNMGMMGGQVPPDGQPGQAPNDMQGNTSLEKSDDMQGNTPPEKPDGMISPDNFNQMDIFNSTGSLNNIFTINGISNLFSGITVYSAQ